MTESGKSPSDRVVWRCTSRDLAYVAASLGCGFLTLAALELVPGPGQDAIRFALHHPFLLVPPLAATVLATLLLRAGIRSSSRLHMATTALVLPLLGVTLCVLAYDALHWIFDGDSLLKGLGFVPLGIRLALQNGLVLFPCAALTVLLLGRLERRELPPRPRFTFPPLRLTARHARALAFGLALGPAIAILQSAHGWLGRQPLEIRNLELLHQGALGALFGVGYLLCTRHGARPPLARGALVGAAFFLILPSDLDRLTMALIGARVGCFWTLGTWTGIVPLIGFQVVTFAGFAYGQDSLLAPWIGQLPHYRVEDYLFLKAGGTIGLALILVVSLGVAHVIQLLWRDPAPATPPG